MSSCKSCDKNNPNMTPPSTINSNNNGVVPNPSPSLKSQGASCPYRMSDGRNFTDYRTRCTIDYETKLLNAFQSSYDQRQFLIQNATKIMHENNRMAESMNECSGCFPKKSHGTMLPEKNMVKCNDKKCDFQMVNPNGLGTGRNYQV